MLMAVNRLPYSLYTYLMDSGAEFSEPYQYRPDLLVAAFYESNVLTEVLCNEISNVSPISAVNGVEYYLPTYRFMQHFLEV